MNSFRVPTVLTSCIFSFFSTSELALLTLVAKEFSQNVNSELLWKQKIKNEIGPNLTLLISKDETAKQAFIRNRLFLKSLSVIAKNKLSSTCLQEMVAETKKYPQFYPDAILTSHVFIALINDCHTLNSVALTVPICRDKLLQETLNHFPQLIRNEYDLCTICNYFPDFTDKFMRHFLCNKFLIDKIIIDHQSLRKLISVFPNFSTSIIQKVLDDNQRFLKIFYDIYALHAVFQKLSKEDATSLMQKVLDVHFTPLITEKCLSTAERLFPSYSLQFREKLKPSLLRVSQL